MDPDYPDETCPPRAPMWDFNYEGKLLQPISYQGNDVKGICHALTVRPEIRDKIIKAEFMPLEKLGSDDLIQQALRQVEMSDPGYASRNVPPEVPKAPIRSKFKIFWCLFLFGSYYLQYYPGKTVSFFDYLLFLMSQVNVLNLEGMQPKWNWNQQCIQLLMVKSCTITSTQSTTTLIRGKAGRMHRVTEAGAAVVNPWEKNR